MAKFKSLICVSAIALAMASCAAPEPIMESQCISGGTIYTADAQDRLAEAVRIEGNIIQYVGAASGDWCPEDATRIDLSGGALYPGLTDAHAHLIGIGLRELQLNLEGTASITDLQNRLSEAVRTTPPGETIYGRGWIETKWPEGRFPTRQDLDTVAPDHPVLLERADGHALVINSYALRRAGINGGTQAPFGGAINLDGQGEPTGMLIDNAAQLVADLMPQMTDERRENAYIKGAEVYAARGWTNIHSMSVPPADIPLINRLSRDGKIGIRVYNSIDLLDRQVKAQMAALNDMVDADSPKVTTRAIKLYADGALGSRGAALLQPYSDDDKNSGLMLLKSDQAQAIFRAALRNGTQVNTHAIGDRANREVLNWYKQAFDSVPKSEWGNPDPRWRIEHAQIIDPADIPMFNALSVIPSMQPSHAIGDLHFAVDRLSPDRLGGAYAWRALIDSGVKIPGGSDAPVEIGDPRIEFYAATQRMDQSGYSNENWNRGQRVSPEEALKMFTAWPAFAAFQDTTLGSIEVGKLADVSAFSQDIMTANGPDILRAEVMFTMVDGQIIYDNR